MPTNNGWFDDISDGPVSGALVLEDGTKLAIDVPAWVLCAPPKYAPEIVKIVTMYDTMYDIFVREFGLSPGLYQNGQFQQSYPPNHDAEITPILIRPNLYKYVAALGPPHDRSARGGAGSGRATAARAIAGGIVGRQRDYSTSPPTAVAG
jgi:hypothetical protein